MSPILRPYLILYLLATRVWTFALSSYLEAQMTHTGLHRYSWELVVTRVFCHYADMNPKAKAEASDIAACL